MHSVAQQQLVSHIAAWGAIPHELLTVNPITHANGDGLGTRDRLIAFTEQVGIQEGQLLRSLGVEPSWVRHFLDNNGLYRLFFWQLPLPWVTENRTLASQVLQDMEPLNESVRTLRRTLDGWSRGPGGLSDEDLLEIGRETNSLRRYLKGRARLAKEVSSLLESEPFEAVTIFYDEVIRRLRRLDPLTRSLGMYLNGSH